jgi:trigger factor
MYVGLGWRKQLKTKVEVLESGATKLTVTIEADDIDKRISKIYKDFGQKYKFPGFRPGHVPPAIVDNMFGKDAVRTQATDELLNEAFPLAVDAEDLNIVGQPTFNDVDGLVQPHTDYVFSAEMEVKPEIELTDYSPLHIEIPFKKATDKEIDDQVKQFASYYADLADSPANTKIKADSTVDLTINATNEKGEKVDVLSSDEPRLYELGKGLFPAAFDEQLVGLKKGDTKSFELKLEDNPSVMTNVAKDKAETVTFDITVGAVKKHVEPTVDDEWVKKTFGMDTVDALRDEVARGIEQQKGEVIPQIMENNALYALQERVDAEIPEKMVEDAKNDLLQNFYQQLNRAGQTLDQYLANNSLSPDQFRDDVARQAEDTVKQNLALDAYARHAGLTVTDEDVSDEFKKSGAKDPEKLYEDWRKEGRLHIVREGILRGKALEAVLADAEIVETENPKAAGADDDEKADGKKADEKKTAAKDTKKPAAKKTTAKKTAAADGAKDDAAADAKPAAKKPAAKKTTAKSTKAAAAKADDAKPAAKKPAAKKTTAKKAAPKDDAPKAE